MGLCKLIVIVGVAALWMDSSNSASIVGHNNLCICTREYAPVCASSGVTYSNKCEFECEKRTSKDLTLMFDGDCADQAAVEDSCICNRMYDPVCSNEGKTYPNECVFKCAQKDNHDLKISSFGECAEISNLPMDQEIPEVQNLPMDQEIPQVQQFKNPCVCFKNYDPVCGNNGKTYSNECMLNCAKFETSPDLEMASTGECKDVKTVSIPEVQNLPMDQEFPEVQQFNTPCVCFKNYSPVCGNDGKTYSNKCMLNCAKFETNPNLEMASTGECEEVNTVALEELMCPCPKIFWPVCASNGRTYANKCLFECAQKTNKKLELIAEGECK